MWYYNKSTIEQLWATGKKHFKKWLIYIAHIETNKERIKEMTKELKSKIRPKKKNYILVSGRVFGN